MEELNIKNYEAWMIDWLEGNLSPARVRALVQFLDQHPELQTLTPESNLAVLSPVDYAYPDKSELFKSDFSIPEASDEEVECIASIEGDLSLADQKIFEQSINADLSKAALLEQFSHIHLLPDDNIVFSGKANLRKKHYHIPAFAYGALATAAALVLGWFILSPIFRQSDNMEVTNDNTREIIYLDKLANPSRFDKIVSSEPSMELSRPATQTDLEIKFIAREPLGEMYMMTSLLPETLNTVMHEPGSHFVFRVTKPNISDDTEYETLIAFSRDIMREQILGQDPAMVKKTKFSFWELADAGLQRLSGFFNLSIIGRSIE